MTKKEALMWFILSLFTLNISVLFLGKKFNLYQKDAWYTNWYYWVLGVLFGIFPALIMLFILVLYVTIKMCILFDVSGKEIYGYPYIWIGSLIVPIFGWTLFLILFIYIYVMYIIGLFSFENDLQPLVKNDII